jgi:hypothetical protein
LLTRTKSFRDPFGSAILPIPLYSLMCSASIVVVPLCLGASVWLLMDGIGPIRFYRSLGEAG